MYYKAIKRNSEGRELYSKVMCLNRVKDYVQATRDYTEVIPIIPEVIEIVPESMRQMGWRMQSFYLEDTQGYLHKFFNCDNFSHLAQIFRDKKVFVYHTRRGGEIRRSIVGTIDETNTEHWF